MLTLGRSPGRFAFLLGLLALGCGGLFAAPVFPGIVDHKQPDGAVFQARGVGDEFWHALETPEGHTLLRNADGWWCFAQRQSDGSLAAGPGRYVAGAPAPRSLAKHLRPDEAWMSQARATQGSTTRGGAARFPPWDPGVAFKPTGTRPTLIILVEFADRALSTTDLNWSTPAFAPTNSMKDYFTKASMGIFTVAPATESAGAADGVIRVTVASNHPGLNPLAERLAVREALTAADPFINFATYDTNSDGFISGTELAFIFIFAGFDQAGAGTQTPAIRAHHSYGGYTPPPTHDGKTLFAFTSYSDVTTGSLSVIGELISNPVGGDTGQQQMTLGTLVHEYCHGLGLPDLYDTTQVTTGVGEFCVMGSGNWNENGGQPGTLPCFPSAWCRWQLGWGADTAGSVGPHTLGDAATAALNDKMRRVRMSGNSQQFLLIENRNGADYDAGLPNTAGSRGLLIWHIDHTQTNNNNPANYLVDLEEASGTQELEGAAGIGDGLDYWRAGTQTTFDGASTPNTNQHDGTPTGISINNISAAGATMTFSIDNGNPAQADPSAGSSFIGVTNGPFNLAVATGAFLSNANIELTDPDGDPIIVSAIVPPGTPPAGIVAPTIPSPGEPLTLSWTGQANGAPGSYLWAITFADEINGTPITINVSINIGDSAPTHAPAPGIAGSGTSISPYSITTTAGIGGSTDIEFATVTEIDIGQTPVIDDPPGPTRTVGSGTNFLFFLQATGAPGTYTLIANPESTLLPTDVGQQVWSIPITDGTNNISIFVAITINPSIVFTSSNILPTAIRHTYYVGFQVTAFGGTGAITFSVPGVLGLPTGITMDTAGFVSGATFATPATFGFIIRATDEAGAFTDQPAQLVVLAPANGVPLITTPILPMGVVNKQYTQTQLVANGGLTPYVWGLAPGSQPMPPGLTLSSTGIVSGIPFSTTVRTILVRVTDSQTVFSDAPFEIRVNSAGTVIVEQPRQVVGWADSGCAVQDTSSAAMTLLLTVAALIGLRGWRRRKVQ